MTPPGSERLQENNRLLAVSNRFPFSPGPGLPVLLTRDRMRRAWLNKHRLLFIQLPFWLMASESHSSGVKIDRWLPSLRCGLLKLALWCDYRTYLACAPGGKVDLWSYSSFKNHRSWKMNQSRKMLEAAFAAEVDCQTNLTSLLFLEFWFFWLKQMTFKPFFFLWQSLEDIWSFVSFDGNPELCHCCGFQMRSVHKALIRRNLRLLSKLRVRVLYLSCIHLIHSLIPLVSIYRGLIICQFCDRNTNKEVTEL